MIASSSSLEEGRASPACVTGDTMRPVLRSDLHVMVWGVVLEEKSLGIEGRMTTLEGS